MQLGEKKTQLDHKRRGANAANAPRRGGRTRAGLRTPPPLHGDVCGGPVFRDRPSHPPIAHLIKQERKLKEAADSRTISHRAQFAVENAAPGRSCPRSAKRPTDAQSSLFPPFWRLLYGQSHPLRGFTPALVHSPGGPCPKLALTPELAPSPMARALARSPLLQSPPSPGRPCSGAPLAQAGAHSGACAHAQGSSPRPVALVPGLAIIQRSPSQVRAHSGACAHAQGSSTRPVALAPGLAITQRSPSPRLGPAFGNLPLRTFW
jgi:hypothetical protein